METENGKIHTKERKKQRQSHLESALLKAQLKVESSGGGGRENVE
jgi:hypothetical protein